MILTFKKAEEYTKNSLKLFEDNLVINWHDHSDQRWFATEEELKIFDESYYNRLVETVEKFHFDKTVISFLSMDDKCSVEKMKLANNINAEGIRRNPDKFVGLCFVNPGYQKEALYEIDRCREMGFIGLKLYHQYKLNDPVLFPIIERCIELDMPILMHAGRLTADQYEPQPKLSQGEYFAEIAKRYPESNLIMAHITGGGDWHWQLKAIEKYDNIVLDMAGSVIDEPVIEECVKRIGAERVLFGTDFSASASVGKIIGADISEEDKKTILCGKRYKRFLGIEG